MNKSDEFLAQVRLVLLQFPKMLWISEGQSPVWAIKLNWWDIFGWKRDTDAFTDQFLKDKAADAEPGDGIAEILKLFIDQEPVISIQRKRKGANVDLYILKKFGRFDYVGIKTRLIQT